MSSERLARQNHPQTEQLKPPIKQDFNLNLNFFDLYKCPVLNN